MASLGDFRRGDAVWVDHEGWHPAIVIADGAESVVVICGTSTVRLYPDQVCVRPKSHTGRALELTMPTFFYPSGIAVVRDAARIRHAKGRCAAGVFIELERLVIGAGRGT